MASQFADIPALNHIIAILIDARRLYTRAMRLAKEPDAVLGIQRTLDERTALLGAMQQRVRELGGKPALEGSVMGAAHAAFLNVRSVFDRDVVAALDEVERGEKYLRAEIRKCMRQGDISAETRAFLGVALDRAVTGEMQIEGVREEAKPEQRVH